MTSFHKTIRAACGFVPIVATRVFAVAVIAVVGLTGQGAPTASQTSKAGKYFEVIYHGGDQRGAELALTYVEPVWAKVCDAFAVPVRAPAKPLQVHLYRTIEGYLAAERRLTSGRFADNQAMSHWQSKSAHVAMQPPCKDAHLAEFGLPLQTCAMLAWEACHIARFELCANFRFHPGWFGDGLAAVTAQTVLRDLHAEWTEQPFFAQRWWRVRRLAEGGELPKVSALLADQTQGLDMRDRYAARVAFFDFARRKQPRKLVSVAKKIRSTVGGPGFAGRIHKVVSRSLGSLGRAFQKYARSTQPKWDESIRSLWCSGDEWRQMAFADTNAVAFCSEPVRGGSFKAKGNVFMPVGQGRQMNFLFARTNEGFYSLALVAGVGFTLFDYRSEGNQWRVVGRGSEPGCKLGVDVPFAIHGRGKKLEVQLAGHHFEIDLPRALPDEIVWGVGAQAASNGARTGSFGLWRGVKVQAP